LQDPSEWKRFCSPSPVFRALRTSPPFPFRFSYLFALFFPLEVPFSQSAQCLLFPHLQTGQSSSSIRPILPLFVFFFRAPGVELFGAFFLDRREFPFLLGRSGFFLVLYQGPLAASVMLRLSSKGFPCLLLAARRQRPPFEIDLSLFFFPLEQAPRAPPLFLWGVLSISLFFKGGALVLFFLRARLLFFFLSPFF